MIDISDKKALELRLQWESTIDPLTGIFNRRYFMHTLKQTLSTPYVKAATQHVSILAIDFDLFKLINDRYGHDIGDEVLIQVTSGMKSQIRRSDTLARMGGEEFCVVLPATNYSDALVIAEKLRNYVESMQIGCRDYVVQLTITIGVASTEQGSPDSSELLRKADQALYQGKRAGGNCVK
jgi:diguanylate cyclase (GGDEF)-like protein